MKAIFITVRTGSKRLANKCLLKINGIPTIEHLIRIAEKQFAYRNPKIYNELNYEVGLCPVAETIQPKIMQFKTNYRDLKLASYKAEVLRKTIEYFDLG